MSITPSLSQRAHWAGGQPISYLMHKALAHPEIISLAAGFVDQHSLPVEATLKGVEAVLSDPRHGRAALQYGTTPGHAPLREALLRGLLEADGLRSGERPVSLDQIVITAGSNELLHLIVDTLFDPGDIVLCAAPTYFVFLGMVRNLGVRSVGVASDEDGIIPEALEEELQRLEQIGELGRVKALYVVSYYDNPSSVTLSPQRRGRIVEIIKRHSTRHRIRILEDAAYRELRYDGEDVASLWSYDEAGDTVVHTQTFSKSFSPGIRLGWGLLPPDLVEPIGAQKSNIDFGSPNFAQHVMAAVMQMGLFRPHIERLRDCYRAKRDAMVAAMNDRLASFAGLDWRRPEGGLYVWLRLPENVPAGPSGRLFDEAVEQGVLYVPGEYSYPAEGQRTCSTERNGVRLSFGVQTPDRIEAGIAALARAMRKVLA